MIFNFYTYLFFSLMAAGSAAAVLIHTVRNGNRRQIWSISSTSFLVQMIISLIILIAGLVVVEPDMGETAEFLIFALVFIFFFAVAFYLIKVITLPIILFVLLGLFLLYSTYLRDFTPFDNNNSFTITLLQEQDDISSVEVKGFDGKIDFIEIDQDQKYPVFVIVDFPEFLFFLKGSSYLKYVGCISDPDKLSNVLADNFNRSSISVFPLVTLRIYDPVPLRDEIFSVFTLKTERDGELIFNTEK